MSNAARNDALEEAARLVSSRAHIAYRLARYFKKQGAIEAEQIALEKRRMCLVLKSDIRALKIVER